MSGLRDYTYMYMCCEVHDLHVATHCSVHSHVHVCIVYCHVQVTSVMLVHYSPAKYYVIAIESRSNVSAVHTLHYGLHFCSRLLAML